MLMHYYKPVHNTNLLIGVDYMVTNWLFIEQIFIQTPQKSVLTNLEPEPLGYCECYALHLNSH